MCRRPSQPLCRCLYRYPDQRARRESQDRKVSQELRGQKEWKAPQEVLADRAAPQ